MATPALFQPTLKKLFNNNQMFVRVSLRAFVCAGANWQVFWVLM